MLAKVLFSGKINAWDGNLEGRMGEVEVKEASTTFVSYRTKVEGKSSFGNCSINGGVMGLEDVRKVEELVKEDIVKEFGVDGDRVVVVVDGWRGWDG